MDCFELIERQISFLDRIPSVSRDWLGDHPDSLTVLLLLSPQPEPDQQ